MLNNLYVSILSDLIDKSGYPSLTVKQLKDNLVFSSPYIPMELNKDNIDNTSAYYGDFSFTSEQISLPENSTGLISKIHKLHTGEILVVNTNKKALIYNNENFDAKRAFPFNYALPTLSTPQDYFDVVDSVVIQYRDVANSNKPASLIIFILNGLEIANVYNYTEDTFTFLGVLGVNGTPDYTGNNLDNPNCLAGAVYPDTNLNLFKVIISNLGPAPNSKTSFLKEFRFHIAGSSIAIDNAGVITYPGKNCSVLASQGSFSESETHNVRALSMRDVNKVLAITDTEVGLLDLSKLDNSNLSEPVTFTYKVLPMYTFPNGDTLTTPKACLYDLDTIIGDDLGHIVHTTSYLDVDKFIGSKSGIPNVYYSNTFGVINSLCQLNYLYVVSDNKLFKSNFNKVNDINFNFSVPVVGYDYLVQDIFGVDENIVKFVYNDKFYTVREFLSSVVVTANKQLKINIFVKQDDLKVKPFVMPRIMLMTQPMV